MIKRIVITALALAAATWILQSTTQGITLDGGWTTKGWLTLLGVALVFGVVNAVVKPVFKVLTGCLVLITFGLFLLVINALMMLLTSWLCGKLGLGWGINAATTGQLLLIAIEGSLIVSVITFIGAKVFPDKK